MDSSPCELCGGEVPLSWERCPHWARPGLFPNVRAAQVPAEREALHRRYSAVVQDAELRGAQQAVEAFEMAARGTKAVMARSFRELDRLTSSTRELFSTYYNLVRGEIRMPDGKEWDELRSVADVKHFPGYIDNGRFAPCPTDGVVFPLFG